MPNAGCVVDAEIEPSFKIGMRTLIIWFLLTVCLLLFNMTQARRKRITNFQPCRPRPLQQITTLRLPGCQVTPFRIRIYACHGYCESESISLTDRKEISRNCRCCTPVDSRKLTTVLTCGNKYRSVTFLTALRCECRKCSPLTR